MTHVRYWAMTLAAAAAGAFIAIDRFAFAPTNAVWIAFGVAIAAAMFSLGASAVALLRENHAFSGLSALSSLVAVFTVIATRDFKSPTSLWLAFAGGVALLLLSMRALALHETTVELVVHRLALNGSGQSTSAVRQISDAMRSWIYWLSHTFIAVAGAFVVASTFIWPQATSQVSPKWLAFSVGAAGVVMASAAVIDCQVGITGDGHGSAAQLAAIATSGMALLSAAALIVVMATLSNAVDLRWWAFALGAAMTGISLVALTVHELTGERLRHQLKGADAVRTDELAATATS